MSFIIEKIKQHARHTPDAVAIITPGQALSYANLLQQIEGLSERLRSGSYQCIGLLADNSANWALIDLACLNTGICCIPVPQFFTEQQIRHLCESAGVEALVGDAEAAAVPGLENNRVSFQSGPDIVIHDIAPRSTPVAHKLQHISKLTFTSGSTGTPKGVCLGHAQIENTVKALDKVVVPGTSQRHLSVLPLVTLLENIAGLYLSLVQGASILLYPMQHIGFTGLASLDEKQFFHILRETRPQSLILVPELLRLLVYGVQNNILDAGCFTFIAVGGGVVSVSLLQQAKQLGLPVLQGYGLSECASVVSLNAPDANKIGSVGRPLQHVDVRIADDGEILVAGNVMDGYLGEKIAAPQWLPTGDLGRFDEQGYLYVTGRKKNLLVTSFGKNVSPEWVESVFQQNPLIKQIVVAGEASSSLRAIIVPAAELGEEQFAGIVEGINQQLPEYARVKNYHIAASPFLFENGFLTANGRLKRAAIVAHYS